MSFKDLQAEVTRSERLLEARGEQLRTHAATFAASWRAGWTPARIVVAGLAAGFVFGRANPLQWARQGGDWMALLQRAAPLLAMLQTAARQAGDAAETAADKAPATMDP